MKAICYHRYGSADVLAVEDVARPVPDEGEVLLRVHAASINAADRVLMHGKPWPVRLAFGLFRPKTARLGTDVAGCVEAVGPGVVGVKPGDEVFGEARLGAFAEFVCAQEKTLVPKPAGVSFEQAAATPMAAYTALQALRDRGGLTAGQSVLIDGASGGVGSFAVQIAKAFGAEVTAVCSTRNVEMLHSIGADHVIDYTAQDFADGGSRYDLIVGANAYRSIRDYMNALLPGGTYVMSGGGGRQVLQAMLVAPWLALTSKKKLGNFLAKVNRDDLMTISKLLESGAVAPAIESICSLAEVPDAIRRIEREHARGKTVVRIV